MKTRLLVTGSSGFVGRHLIQQLQGSTDLQVRALVRRLPDVSASDVEYAVLPDFSAVSPEHPAVQGVDVVVHLASRVHVMNDTEVDPLAAFRRVNVGHTLALARSAAAAGARRFVFVSSVKVNGEKTALGRPFRETDPSAPVDPYGISKMEAEDALKALALDTGLEVVIIRPVLVYGPGVKANFESMMKWLVKRVPLPFGAIRNQRSLVALDNLVSLILTCTTHPAASNQVFLASDGEDVSTTELLRKFAIALDAPARLIPIPQWLLVWGAMLLGKKALSQRLCGSLQVDITKARKVLGWQPPLTLEQGLEVTAQHYFSERTE
ncbi:NAD-dependent dehydratase [Pseudomonas sp. FDAARGOS_380]|uniref:UDP-glucose 4-epimerase family protein n=1 Tax=unclassified Pseudomonas TaxID=196821 RepID=UPI000BFC7505|nr:MULTISPECIES: SDR family oxidoreductase [unclassified Pseudomonas]ATN13370.1 NAD-dependent dehydratase [Pseudomonas sp. FDAARGOS_380]NMX29988.1 SDR family oxidoreductase [Pseudomonas sp. WS 5406]